MTKDKNDVENYLYSAFGISFDRKSTFSHSDGSNAHAVIIFGADSNQSIHNGNRLAGCLNFRKRFNTKNK